MKISLFFLIFLLFICFQFYPQKGVDVDAVIKKYPPKNGRQLRLKSSIPSGEEDGYLSFFCMNGDSVYCTDFKSCKIFEYDLNGLLRRTIGRKGQGPGEFNNILGISSDREGNLIAFDGGNRRIQLLDRWGKHLYSFKIFFTSFSRIVTDQNANIYIAPSINPNGDWLIEVYNNKGSLINKIGKNNEELVKSMTTLNIDFIKKD